MRERTAETAASESTAWLSPDGAVLVVLSGAAEGKTVRAPAREGDTLRVGKARDNDLVLADGTVSRHHAEITRTAQGLVARDLESRNGTRVAGVRVREAMLEPGALIELGDTRLLLRLDASTAASPPSARLAFGLATGKSLAMRRIFGLLERVAPTDATILFTGETGTGKDVLARSVHAASARASGPFEVVDCGAISPSLIESELFGHERGAFTGAVSAHEGAFERAAGGTLFLDELGELPLALQPKLLRVLEARQIRRVGGKRTLDVDVRVIAATTRDLVQAVHAGGFRQDLYFRLAVVSVHVPPLRERVEDIEVLAKHLLASIGDGLPLAPDALALLRSRAWPGNVREMRNVLERAAVFARASGASAIERADVVEPRAPASPASDLFAFTDGVTYRDARARVEAAFERAFVAWILGKSGGNVAAAAREAKMDRKYLADLAKKHGL